MSAAYFRALQRALNRFYRRYKLPGDPLTVDGRPGARTKTRIKDAKWLLGYRRGYRRWATGSGLLFLRRLKHPTTLMTRAAWRRGIDRRNAARRQSISNRGVRFIADFEGYFPNWYLDPVGVRTIGYGHTDEGLPEWARPPLSRTTALALLRHDLRRYEAAVKGSVKVPLTQGQYDALVSFTYNVGAGALRGSTLLRKLNARDYKGAANEFKRWTRGGGRELPGLVRRRNAEAAMFRNH